MSIIMIVSGGQSGADLGGLRAAKRLGITTGGYMPLGWRTEYGPRPNYAEYFNLEEWTTSDYKDRTKQNVMVSDGTIICGHRSPGSNATEEFCRSLNKPCLWITAKKILYGPDPSSVSQLSCWISDYDLQVLNVAGNRESVCLGIEFAVENFLMEALS
ncbi:MAG: YpsA SLOG family protein [Nitrospiraceae bacterium]